jgi:transcriptional regulator with XRE-family HTH domain
MSRPERELRPGRSVLDRFGYELRTWRKARGLSQDRLGSLVHVSGDLIYRIELGQRRPSRDLAHRCDQVLNTGEALQRRWDEMAAEPQQARGPLLGTDSPAVGTDNMHDVQRLTAWIADTNTSDDAIGQIARASVYLAEAHTHMPAKKVLAEVLRLHEQTQALLLGGKQRLRQTREILRVESDLLAHACLLLGDLGQDLKARKYGDAALLMAQEAEANEAIAWSVLAKTARWQGRYVESAELARRGFEVSTLTPTRVELAYREANAIALFGDAGRARRALRRAEEAAETLPSSGGGMSVWSFPVERQAVFALSVAIYTGDPDTALRAAATADAGWAAGDTRVPATWAQIRTEAAIAYLMKGALDGTAEQIIPVLSLPPELRIGTVTGYLRKLTVLLNQPRLADSKIATDLRQQIDEFNSAIALDVQVMESA